MKNKKKNKSFYEKQQRNQKWTEEQTGRKIDFADKYLYDGTYSDKFDYKRPKQKNVEQSKAKKKRCLKRCVVAIICVVLICIGYTGMDLYMARASKPAELLNQKYEESDNSISQVSLDLVSKKVESVSLDNSVMLQSIIETAQELGYNSITFDAKRDDGTIGYQSSLASVDTYGAISSASAYPKQSVEKLLANDILPVARISCYKDNIATSDTNMAITSNSDVFKDSDNNCYLNPNSESTYNYIKDIIDECTNYGIYVFVLSNCDLPEEISEYYNDGFSYIASKLEKDFNNSIRIYEEYDVTIDESDLNQNSNDVDYDDYDNDDDYYDDDYDNDYDYDNNYDEDDNYTEEETTSTPSSDESIFESITSNQVYYISTQVDEQTVVEYLKANNIVNYILIMG